VAGKKIDYNNRMKVKEFEKLKKKKLNLIIQDFKLREILDETGEVKGDTVIQISFEGILITLSVPAAIKLTRELSKLLQV
jgi:hypothetical protein